jgi:hypothetical protein
MNGRVLWTALLLSTASQAQESRHELWMWKDANGVVHYSDVPGPGAKRVDISVDEPPAAPAAAPAAPTPGQTPAPAAAAAVTYDSLEIWQPESGESFFGADAVVNVRMRSEPELAPGDSLLLYLDGKLVDGDGRATEYSLANIDRGAHSITATIRDRRGQEKIRSAPVVFHIKQPTVIPPAAVGPNLKPAPPPAPSPRPATGPRGG